MSGRQESRMPARRGTYPQRGQAHSTLPLRGTARGALSLPLRGPARGALSLPLRGTARGGLYQRGLPRGALAQRAGSRGAYRQRGGLRRARRGYPPLAPAEEDHRTLKVIATELWGNVRKQEWWREFWRRLPAKRRCAVFVGVCVGAWAAVALAAVGGAGGAALLVARTARADAWAAVYADRAVLLAYLTALAAASALLLLPAAAVLAAGLALRSDALVEGYLWAVVAHLVVDWLATGCMAVYCLAEPACLRGHGAGAPCRVRGNGGGAAFLVTGSVLMLGYSAMWVHLLIAVNSYRHTFDN